MLTHTACGARHRFWRGCLAPCRTSRTDRIHLRGTDLVCSLGLPMSHAPLLPSMVQGRGAWFWTLARLVGILVPLARHRKVDHTIIASDLPSVKRPGEKGRRKRRRGRLSPARRDPSPARWDPSPADRLARRVDDWCFHQLASSRPFSCALFELALSQECCWLISAWPWPR